MYAFVGLPCGCGPFSNFCLSYMAFFEYQKFTQRGPQPYWEVMCAMLVNMLVGQSIA